MTTRRRNSNRALTADEVRAIFKLDPSRLYRKFRSEYAIRDPFIFTLAFSMGCRVQEFVSIDRKKIDYQNNLITVHDYKKDQKWQWDVKLPDRHIGERRTEDGHYTKGIAWRAIKLPSDVMELVKVYESRLPIEQKTLFNMSPKALERLVQRYTSAIGNTKSFHAIRHTYATLAREAGVPVKFVAKQFGDNVETVQKVYEELSEVQEDKYANTKLF